MDLLRRFKFYLIGITIGIIPTLFILKAKGSTFDYGFDARTLKQIRIRKRVFSEQAKRTMMQHHIDTAEISTILRNADVDFGKSKPRKTPCPEYFITSEKIDLYVIRCDSVSTIDKVFAK